jgi:pectin methylesterase-like acyl-CoA thioesterase
MKTIHIALIVLVLAPASWATTWHVAKDGSGDFTVIQDAVDAASPGDTIWIHAGRYDETIQNFAPWGQGSVVRADVHVAITKDNLTLRGDGAGLTIIGPEVLPPPPPSFNYWGICATHLFASSLTLQDLRIENVWEGVYGVVPNLLIENCEFVDIVESGLGLNVSNVGIIRDCVFTSNGMHGIIAFSSTNELFVTRCQFNGRGVGFVGVANAVVEDCTFVGGVTAINYQQGSQGTVRDCVMTGYQNYGLVSLSGAQVHFDNCSFSGGGCGLWVRDQNARATGNTNTFSGHSYTTIRMSHGHLELHESLILNGGGWSVLCEGDSMAPYHIDLTSNDWGTTDADQIAAWIWDRTDDPTISCTVDYIPFQGVVTVENQCWSTVKGLFRE